MSSFKTKAGTNLPILNLRGKEYLEVKYRLVWFREEHPAWSIETDLVAVASNSATSKATIKDETGRIIATAHKSENAQGFPDFMEKAETGSIGRALALIGYGTQFCADELDEGDRIVDAPVSKPNIHAPSNMQPAHDDGDPQANTGYTIPFGKFNKRSLEEVGPRELASYVEYLEKTAIKKGEPLTGKVAEFRDLACGYIASFENAPL